MYTIIIIIIIFVIGLLVFYFKNDGIDICLINKKNNNYIKYHDSLKKFEHKMSNWYDLGNDKFRIDHGTNYYKFFERMGNVYIQAAIKNNEIIGTGAGVLRNIRGNKIFYLCDCKIDKNFRNKWLPFRMLLKSNKLANITNKCYCISMNKGNGCDNKIVRLLKRVKWLIDFKYAGNMLIYSVNGKQLKHIRSLIEKHKGLCYFVSLKGVKDLILKSTNKPMELYHINYVKNIDFNNTNNISYDIYDDATYMFCFHEKDNINKILEKNGITTDVTASIVQHGLDKLKPDEWDFIQTSEI